MGNFFSELMKKDLDDIFSYKTPKVVKVRDRRLGIPYYTFMFLIFSYICYTVIVNQRYLKTEEPGGGSIRTTLEVPKITEPDYKPVQMGSKTIEWLYWNPSQIVYPAGIDGSLHITTRVTVRNLVYENDEALNESDCNPHLPTRRICRTKTSSSAKVYYVADIEQMTVMVEHTIQGNLLPITKINKELYGELLNSNDEVIWRYYPTNYTSKIETKPNYTERNPSIPGDIFKISTLLEATGFNLDDENNNGETYRYTGCVIVVLIEYNNKEEEIQYKYKPTLIKHAEMKILEIIADNEYVSSKTFNKLDVDYTINDSVGWKEYNRHGIEIRFVQLGNIGKFDFMQLCMNLVASIAMLSVASKIVESLMLYILPEKGIYKRFKFELTEDFSDIRDNNKRNKKQLKEDERMEKMRDEKRKTVELEDV